MLHDIRWALTRRFVTAQVSDQVAGLESPLTSGSLPALPVASLGSAAAVHPTPATANPRQKNFFKNGP